MAKAKGIWINDKEFVNFTEDKVSSLTQEIATRDRSIDFYSLGMYLPNPDPVLKKMGKDVKVYKELLTDAHLGGCVSSRKSAVKSLEWEIDRGKAKSRQAKLITDVFSNLDIDRLIGEMLDAVQFGHQELEVTWERVGNYILPKDIVGKPQEWFVFSDENELRFLTKQNVTTGEALPPRKFLLIQHEATYVNPYGFAELSRCFWPVTFKKGGYKFWVTMVEKYGMPWPIGKLPRGLDKKEYDALYDILASMVQDGVAVIPDDGSVELLTTKGSGSTVSVHNELIESCKTEISIAQLGQNLTTQVTGGSLAATTGHMQVRQDITDSDSKLVIRAFNVLIKWIDEINFAGGETPVFTMYEQEDVDKTLAERDGLLSRDAGVRFTPAYFQRAYGFEKGDIASVGNPQQSTISGQPSQFSERKGQSRIYDPLKRLRNSGTVPECS